MEDLRRGARGEPRSARCPIRACSGVDRSGFRPGRGDQVHDRDLVEPGHDLLMECPHRLDDLADREAGTVAALKLCTLDEPHRVIDRSEDIAESDLGRTSGEVVPTVRPLLGADELGARELLRIFARKSNGMLSRLANSSHEIGRALSCPARKTRTTNA